MRKFIIDNDISFKEGNRNLSVTILIGYAQFLGLSKSNLIEELHDEISNDPFISKEIERLWDYLKAKNYKSFWLKSEAHDQYIF